MPTGVRGDGSRSNDQIPTIQIDRTDPADRWWFVCPNGHTSWEGTNSHI
jgi:hypothetical protein